jgi:hypothetical protein
VVSLDLSCLYGFATDLGLALMVGLDGVLVPISLSVYWPNDGCSLVLLFVSFCAFDSTFF